MSKPDDEIFLGDFKQTRNKLVADTIKLFERKCVITGLISCNSAFCIAGNMPELWPEKYGWGEDGDEPKRIGTPPNSQLDGANLIYDLIPNSTLQLKKDYPDIADLFDLNFHPDKLSDREVIELRLKAVMQSTSLEELNNSIEG